MGRNRGGRDTAFRRRQAGPTSSNGEAGAYGRTQDEGEVLALLAPTFKFSPERRAKSASETGQEWFRRAESLVQRWGTKTTINSG